MQDESDTLAEFSDRLTKLRARLGGDMTKTALAIGVSRETLYAILKGKQPLTAKTERKLAMAESQILTPESDMQEEPGAYRVRSVIPEPTVVELRALFEQVAKEAQGVPGGIFNLTRVLRRFQAEYLTHSEPLDVDEAARQKLAELKARVRSEMDGKPGTAGTTHPAQQSRAS